MVYHFDINLIRPLMLVICFRCWILSNQIAFLLLFLKIWRAILKMSANNSLIHLLLRPLNLTLILRIRLLGSSS